MLGNQIPSFLLELNYMCIIKDDFCISSYICTYIILFYYPLLCKTFYKKTIHIAIHCKSTLSYKLQTTLIQYVLKYLRMYVRTYVCMYYAYVCMCVCMFVYTYVCIYVTGFTKTGQVVTFCISRNTFWNIEAAVCLLCYIIATQDLLYK